MKKYTAVLMGVLFVSIFCKQGSAASYNFTQTFDGTTTISGSFNVVNDTFWNSDEGYTANSSTTSALLSDLSLTLSSTSFDLSNYTLTAWNIFLATPDSASIYYVGDDIFPNGYAEGFYSEFISTDGSMLQIVSRLGYDFIWDPIYGPTYDYDHPWYGKIQSTEFGSATTQNLMVVTPSNVIPTPEPGFMVFLGLGLAGLACVRKMIQA
jgi:hypothetical protein